MKKENVKILDESSCFIERNTLFIDISKYQRFDEKRIEGKIPLIETKSGNKIWFQGNHLLSNFGDLNDFMIQKKFTTAEKCYLRIGNSTLTKLGGDYRMKPWTLEQLLKDYHEVYGNLK